MLDLGTVRPGSTIYIPFSTFAASTGAPITMTNFAAGDVLIYKDGGTTERVDTTAYTATTDFDSKTGIHCITINLASDATAGFFKAGSRYFVAVGDVTVDSQTVRFVAATFYIGYEGAILDTHINGAPGSQTSFVLNAGPAEDDALNGCVVCIHDLANATQFGFAVVNDYTGSTKTVTLTAATTFTIADGDNVSVFPPSNTRWLGSTAQTGRDIGASVLLSSGTGTGQLDFTSGVVKANATQFAGQTITCSGGVTIPAATLASTTNITAATGVTVSTNSDKTGYSLTQSFPTNFASLAITGGGAVTAGTVSDKTGYSLTNLTVGAGTTLASGTHNPQTGDAFARLGAPAGASTAADIAAVKAETASILTDTAEIGAAGDGLTAVPGLVRTELATELGRIDAATSTRATPAQVNAEVLDVLNVDSFAEPTGVPPASNTLAGKIGVNYMMLRNQVTVTATKKQFYDDAGNVEFEKDLSDDGTTYTETEVNAP